MELRGGDMMKWRHNKVEIRGGGGRREREEEEEEEEQHYED